jgi:hypothetical protein
MVTLVNKDLYINKVDSSNNRGCEEMKALKALRVILFTFIFLLGYIIPTLTINPVLAESSSGQTTLYFTDALNYEDNSNFSEFGFASLSQTTPTKQNDSEYPPSLFIKNTSNLIPRLNTEKWLTWFSTSWLLYFLEDSEDFNYSFFDGIFGDFELFLPNPYRIVEEYTYNGNDSVKINGNILYNLYFKSPSTVLIKSTDNVNVGIYSINMNSALPLPKQLRNTTIALNPGSSNGIYNQQITLENINLTLAPGDSLLFTIEIIPSNKTIATNLAKLIPLSLLEKCANRLENFDNQTLQDIGTFLKDILSLLNESNITSDDFAEIINTMISSSFIYDSANHPASVTIPAKISEEDIRVYYLRSNQEMNENRPGITNQSGIFKLTETQNLWTSGPFERNKILNVNDISADLYFDYYEFSNFRKGAFTVTVTLYDNNTTITTSEKKFERPSLLEIATKPIKSFSFLFSGSDWEITYGHTISIGVSLKNGADVDVNLLYDSSDNPSSLRVKLDETQNIKITDITSNPLNRKIIPGGTVDYTLNITSEKADILQINSVEREKTGQWEITTPGTTTVSANSWTNIHVIIKSLSNLKESYGNTITLSFIVSGNTGIARQDGSAEISQDAIQYDVGILSFSNNINISKGENRTFYFVIKNNNTGAIDDVDSYTITATSKNHWPLIPRENIRDLQIGDSTNTDDARVVIQAPKNTTLDSDIITITVTSDSNPSATATINVTVHVIGGGVLEDIYDLFDSVAETIGLNEIFGSYGPIVLVSILMVIILFLLIILALVFTTKNVRIICTDRIKEIDTTQKAIFELTLQNPINKAYSYEIFAQQTAHSSKWILTVEPPVITLAGRQTKTVQVIVTPTNKNDSKDWTQVTVYAKKAGKKKTESITLIAMIKEGKTLLKLDNVSHWPTVFNPGEKVTTFCSVSNNGSVSARDVKVFFYLNGKQKNIIDATIPAGNIADIQIPWMAVKGKNKVRIRVKE